MLIFNAFRDFAHGLVRGFSLFFTERGEYDECFTMPEAALTKCLYRKPPEATAANPR